MDSSEDEDPLSDHQQENEGTTKAFTSLISAMGLTKNRTSVTKFVKILEDIPEISLPHALPRKATLSLVESGLVG